MYQGVEATLERWRIWERNGGKGGEADGKRSEVNRRNTSDQSRVRYVPRLVVSNLVKRNPRPSLEDGNPDQPSPPLSPLTQHTSRLIPLECADWRQQRAVVRSGSARRSCVFRRVGSSAQQRIVEDSSGFLFLNAAIQPILHQLSSTPRISTTSAEDALAPSLIFTEINSQKLQGLNNSTTYLG